MPTPSSLLFTDLRVVAKPPRRVSLFHAAASHLNHDRSGFGPGASGCEALQTEKCVHRPEGHSPVAVYEGTVPTGPESVRSCEAEWIRLGSIPGETAGSRF